MHKLLEEFMASKINNHFFEVAGFNLMECAKKVPIEDYIEALIVSEHSHRKILIYCMEYAQTS